MAELALNNNYSHVDIYIKIKKDAVIAVLHFSHIRVYSNNECETVLVPSQQERYSILVVIKVYTVCFSLS